MYKSFNNCEDAIEYLNTVKREWVTIDGSSDLLFSLREWSDTALVRDKEYPLENALFVTINGKEQFVNRSAFVSLNKRLGLNDPLVHELNAVTYKDALNQLSHKMRRKGCVVSVLEDSVRSFMSFGDNKLKYRPLSALELMQANDDCIKELLYKMFLPDFKCVEDDDYISARWSIKASVVTEFGYDIQITMMTPNDIYGAVKYTVALLSSDSVIPVLGPIKTDHRNKNIEVNPVLPKGILPKVEKAIMELDELKKIEIKSPYSVIEKHCKENKLPKFAYRKVLEDYKIAHSGKVDTAYNVYMTLCSVLPIYEKNHNNVYYQETNREAVRSFLDNQL